MGGIIEEVEGIVVHIIENLKDTIEGNQGVILEREEIIGTLNVVETLEDTETIKIKEKLGIKEFTEIIGNTGIIENTRILESFVEMIGIERDSQEETGMIVTIGETTLMMIIRLQGNMREEIQEITYLRIKTGDQDIEMRENLITGKGDTQGIGVGIREGMWKDNEEEDMMIEIGKEIGTEMRKGTGIEIGTIAGRKGGKIEE